MRFKIFCFISKVREVHFPLTDGSGLGEYVAKCLDPITTNTTGWRKITLAGIHTSSTDWRITVAVKLIRWRELGTLQLEPTLTPTANPPLTFS